jgi:hypothetical protein
MKITVKQLKALIKEQVEENLFTKPVQEFDTAGYPSKHSPSYPESWKRAEAHMRASDSDIAKHEAELRDQSIDSDLLDAVEELLETHSMTDIFKALYKAQAWKKRGL